MSRNTGLPKMEPTYDLSLNQRDALKRTLTLDFNSQGAKKAKMCGDTPSAAVLSTPDMVMLKLSSPELEKWIMEHPTGVTPTPTQIFFPAKPVTEEQERYARGFVDALSELQHSDSSQSGQPSDPLGDPLAPRAIPASDQQYIDYGLCSSPESSIVIKEEPQTVPYSPPVSPIDMESQERIKLERKRQRNRVAAHRCRQRKLERIAVLEEKVKVLKGENSELSQHVSKLKEEVYQLKQQVMEHAKNGCHISVIPIQEAEGGSGGGVGNALANHTLAFRRKSDSDWPEGSPLLLRCLPQRPIP